MYLAIEKTRVGTQKSKKKMFYFISIILLVLFIIIMTLNINETISNVCIIKGLIMNRVRLKNHMCSYINLN